MDRRNNENTVSIIVPVYNAEKYIRNTIDSLLNQTYHKIDILLIDDGSTDSSLKICESYSDDRIRVFHKENGGLSSSRQFGIDHAIGEYLCTLDSDDYYDSNFVQHMLNKIVGEKADVCLCERFDVNEENKREIRRLTCPKDTIKITLPQLQENLCKIGSYYFLSDSWNKIYRTDFVRSSGVRFELPKGFNGNDLVFNYKLIMHCPKIAVINEPLIFHRIVDGSMVHRRKQTMQSGFELIIDQLRDESTRCGIDLDNQLSLLYYKLLSFVILNITYYSENRNIEIDLYLENHKKFVSDHGFIKMDTKLLDDVSMLTQLMIEATMNRRSLKLKAVSNIHHYLHCIKNRG